MRLPPTPSRNENPARTGVKGIDIGAGVGVLRIPLARADDGAGRLLSERSFFVVDAMAMNKFRDEPKQFDFFVDGSPRNRGSPVSLQNVDLT